MQVAALVVLGLGVLLVLIATCITLLEVSAKQRAARASRKAGEEAETKVAGVAETLDALGRFFTTIGGLPIAARLFAVGVLLIIVGAAMGGVGALFF